MDKFTPDHSQFFCSEDSSKLYIKYRPTYPDRLYEKVFKFCQESETCTWELAVDVACGSGQSTLPLAKFFKQVIAVDSSEKQISQAPQHMSDISFRCGSAYDLKFISSGSVDLVTVATAFHWFDPERFFEEADRILKPGGSLILYSFGPESFTHPEADRYIQYLNLSSKYVAKYYPATEKLINRYRDVTLPYPGWRREEIEPLLYDLSIEDYGGFVASLGSAQWFTDSPRGHDLPGEIIRTLRFLCWKELDSDLDYKLTVSFPLFFVMGRKPNGGKKKQ
ncbi:putative methyltransferase DDB_G0268948 [Aplysia californica]|uniref:Methyltransferase DDB_G0268948 n=1 Tax=Aplysia californica TaxID=6500 RepID=A0ABM0ZUS0_APLCA|nr:putative methyltransferase DDB_G0268948 [Aplysia californica]